MNFEIISTAILWFFVILTFFFAFFKCKKIRFFPSFLIFVSVTFFSLLFPSGEILLSFGSFKITFDSLILGLRRSGILVGTVFLSRIVVFYISRKNISDKTGKIKNKLTEVLYFFNLLTENKISLKKGNIIKNIDERLLVIWKENGGANG